MPGQELERKFVLGAMPFELSGYSASEIRQGYLVDRPGRLRGPVRRRGGRRSLTLKRAAGIVRDEEELDSTKTSSGGSGPLTEGRRVEKTRSRVPAADGLAIELDVYAGPLEGLIMAEIEFASRSKPSASSRPAGSAARSPRTRLQEPQAGGRRTTR